MTSTTITGWAAGWVLPGRQPGSAHYDEVFDTPAQALQYLADEAQARGDHSEDQAWADFAAEIRNEAERYPDTHYFTAPDHTRWFVEPSSN